MSYEWNRGVSSCNCHLHHRARCGPPWTMGWQVVIPLQGHTRSDHRPAAAGPLGGSHVSGYTQRGSGHVDTFLLGTCLRRKLQAPRVSCAQLRKCCRFSNLTKPTALRPAGPRSLTWPRSATTAGLRLLTTATAVPTSAWCPFAHHRGVLLRSY